MYSIKCEGCGQYEFEYDIEPKIAGRYYGPPENCFPDEGGEAELLSEGKCPHCGWEPPEPTVVYRMWDDDRENDYDPRDDEYHARDDDTYCDCYSDEHDYGCPYRVNKQDD